jgi:hypothetical protein
VRLLETSFDFNNCNLTWTDIGPTVYAVDWTDTAPTAPAHFLNVEALSSGHLSIIRRNRTNSYSILLKRFGVLPLGSGYWSIRRMAMYK